MASRSFLRLTILALLFVSLLVLPFSSRAKGEDSPYKVYVMLGFHVSFYHSWRGDTPDEAGFGTDIRVVREILKMMNQANAQGQAAKGYWDFDSYWTMQEIIPAYAPDIITGIRERVASGLDEVTPMPYNNGANHAATEDEFRQALRWAMENPSGSGARQLFGQATPIYRAQECMYTTGMNRILLEEGYQGHVLYYSSIAFDSFSAFVPTLPPEQRYNPLWFRSVPEEKPIVVFPIVSPGDVVNYISFERWLMDLHKLQTSGQVKSDLLLHLNFDADAETWIPIKLPKGLRWVPNTGGLVEYLNAVNKYPWAAFTTPGAYLKDHPPSAEVLVRQDLADGAFDGSYSWAEKYASLNNWTKLEQSRLYSYRAMALAKQVPEKTASDLDRRLWQGPDSSFFQRLIGLTTTHFGMSTPIINEERQAKAEKILSGAREVAAAALADAAHFLRGQAKTSGPALYEFEVYNYARGKNAKPQAAKMVVRVPVILPKGIEHIGVKTADGAPVPASLLNVKKLPDGTQAGEVWFPAEFGPEERKIYRIEPAPAGTAPTRPESLQNQWLELGLSEKSGVAGLKFKGREIGAGDFLKPFISYRTNKQPVSYFASGYRREDLAAENWNGLKRVRLHGEIPMDTPNGRFVSEADYTFTLFDDLPYLFADVEFHYAYTPPQDVIHTVQQKLRRLLDLRWIEVAPFQLNPSIFAPAEKPLRVWKHNYLGITAYYDLNYGQINPQNKNLDAFNHQVTAGWVAMSNGQTGLLIGENAEVLSTLAFCPMRLRETEGVQHLSLNPFGSYFGKQLDYSHLGGNGVGTAMAVLASGSLKPNGPSYNGETERFSLLLAPYAGDAPPQEMQDNAAAFFYPFGVVYLKTPAGIEAVVPEDLRALIAAKEKAERMQSTAPLPPPTAFLASPSDAASDLVWDPPRDDRVTGYEVRFKEAKAADWQSQKIAPDHRHHVPDLKNGIPYRFQVRALASGRESPWTVEAACVPGPVKTVNMFSAAAGASPGLLLKVIYNILKGALTTL